MIHYDHTLDGKLIAVYIGGDIETDHRTQIVADFERRFPSAKWIPEILCYALAGRELLYLADFVAACAQQLRRGFPPDIEFRIARRAAELQRDEGAVRGMADRMAEEAQRYAQQTQQKGYFEAFRQFYAHYGQSQQATANGFWRGYSASTPAPKADSPYAVLRVAEGAPIEVVDAAYRALAKIHHPDKGGDEAEMRRINVAYEKIKGR